MRCACARGLGMPKKGGENWNGISFRFKFDRACLVPQLDRYQKMA
jgi:hypothetical protein